MAGRSLNVTILTMTRSRRFQRRIPAPGVEEINIPENWLKTLANKSLYALLGASADDLAACMTARFHPALRRAFERESRRAKVIVLTHPYMTNLARVVRNKPILYESLNVETDLKAVLFGPRFWGRWAARMVRRCEERAVYMSRAVAACSTENADSFRALFPEAMRDPAGDVKPVILAPNGVLCRAHWLACGWTNAATPETLDAPPPIDRAALKRRAGLADETVAVFLGSGHPPNQRAALFIIEKLAPRHPNVLFLILGGVCWAVHDRIVPSNVLLLYECDETLKNRVLGMADIALNPLSEGSGVSLKTMDCLAAGATILSTEVGARGVDIQDGANGLIRPLEGFDEALEELAKDPARRHSLGEAGRLLAWRRYDWNITSRAFIETLENWVLEQENG
jgi:glycosyltransferase involved in cell wall biosynthesis